jgi:hypothetical protein
MKGAHRREGLQEAQRRRGGHAGETFFLASVIKIEYPLSFLVL